METESLITVKEAVGVYSMQSYGVLWSAECGGICLYSQLLRRWKQGDCEFKTSLNSRSYLKNKKQNKKQHWGCSSGEVHSLSMHEALGSIPSTEKKKVLL
jgi:hypothetical protein